jgi:hypothetical protein
MKKLIQLIINLFWVAIFVWAVIGLASCRKNDTGKPEVATQSDVAEASAVTEAFFEAMEEHDFEQAEELVTPDTRPLLTQVMNNAQKYREKNGDYPEISIEIINQKPAVEQIDLTVKITVGEQEKQEVVKVVLIENNWLVAMPKKQLALLNFVVFYDRFEIVMVRAEKPKKHPRGHAYGHKKHGHDDDH